MRTLQKELEDLRAQRSREAAQAREDQAELDALREKCERLESGGMSGAVGMSTLSCLYEADLPSIGWLRCC